MRKHGDASTEVSNNTKVWRRIRIVRVLFDLTVKPEELAAIRGALGGLAVNRPSMLHNHASDGSLRYRYPLIQYYAHQGKAAAIGIDQGADELLAALSCHRVSVMLGGRSHELKASNIRFRSASILVWNRRLQYHIRQWAPLDQSTEAAYLEARRSQSLHAFFARRLTGNMLAFAKGIGYHVPERIDTEVLAFDGPYEIPYKGIRRLCFNLTFETNFSLPVGIGLGKHTSVGFGRIVSAGSHPQS